MSTITINVEPNSMKEIRMLSRMTWKEIVSILVRTDEKFLTDCFGTYDPAKQNHAVRLTIAEAKDDRYTVSMEFVWRDKDGYHRSMNTQEFLGLQYMPDYVWEAIHGPNGEYSVMLHASELQEYKPAVLNYKDNKYNATKPVLVVKGFYSATDFNIIKSTTLGKLLFLSFSYHMCTMEKSNN